jgi:acetyl-CoA acyltransferase
MMQEVVIVGAVRTPIAKFRGGLKHVRADHLGALVLNELLARAKIGPEVVDDVIFGNVTQVGEQSGNIARTALLSAGWPETIPGMTVDRKCGSSEAAIHVAVGAIAAGACDVVVAGGAESMTRVPMGGNRDVHGEVYGWLLRRRFELPSQGQAAEMLCDRWNLTRADLDSYAIASHQRAARAEDAGKFADEIAAVTLASWSEPASESAALTLERDETIRRDTSLEKLGTLKTVFRSEGGRVTAGNASQISDGAAAVLLMSAEKAVALGLRPRARIRAITTVGSDPVLMLTGPIAATRRVVQRAGLSLRDVDLFEVNEAFAPVSLIWMKELGIGHERLNVNGGAIALGHPLGASGARIMTTLLHELERRKATFGVQSICCAGGLATATVLERLP